MMSKQKLFRNKSERGRVQLLHWQLLTLGLAVICSLSIVGCQLKDVMSIWQDCSSTSQQQHPTYTLADYNNAPPASSSSSSFNNMFESYKEEDSTTAIVDMLHQTDIQKSKYKHRNMFVEKYLFGYGIEIGAKNVPQQLPQAKKNGQQQQQQQAFSINVDHMSTEELITKYTGPTDKHKKWIQGIKSNPVIRVDDAETLQTFESQSLDFIIANHVLEHVTNFLHTLYIFSNKLRLGGVVFMALPDKRYVEEDKNRPITPPQLFIEELYNTTLSKSRHFQKVVDSFLYRNKRPDDASKTFTQDEMEQAIASANKHISTGGTHIHTFTTESLMTTFSIARLQYNFPLQLVTIHQVFNENIVVLRKVGNSDGSTVDNNNNNNNNNNIKCYATELRKYYKDGSTSLKNDPKCPADVTK